MSIILLVPLVDYNFSKFLMTRHLFEELLHGRGFGDLVIQCKDGSIRYFVLVI